jgi:hypothetical protein
MAFGGSQLWLVGFKEGTQYFSDRVVNQTAANVLSLDSTLNSLNHTNRMVEEHDYDIAKIKLEVEELLLDYKIRTAQWKK